MQIGIALMTSVDSNWFCYRCAIVRELGLYSDAVDPYLGDNKRMLDCVPVELDE